MEIAHFMAQSKVNCFSLVAAIYLCGCFNWKERERPRERKGDKHNENVVILYGKSNVDKICWKARVKALDEPGEGKRLRDRGRVEDPFNRIFIARHVEFHFFFARQRFSNFVDCCARLKRCCCSHETLFLLFFFLAAAKQKRKKKDREKGKWAKKWE